MGWCVAKHAYVEARVRVAEQAGVACRGAVPLCNVHWAVPQTSVRVAARVAVCVRVAVRGCGLGTSIGIMDVYLGTYSA